MGAEGVKNLEPISRWSRVMHLALVIIRDDDCKQQNFRRFESSGPELHEGDAAPHNGQMLRAAGAP
jgi:hypothetical protein